MKKLMVLALLATGLMSANAQATEDKSKRPSPPAQVEQTLPGGSKITINYSQPALKGREVGKDIEPMEGKIWRTGANEATVFNTSKDVIIMGQVLPAGKYSLFTIYDGKQATVIFNKTWDQWGAYDYKSENDQLRIQTKVTNTVSPAERLLFNISPDGNVSLDWGNTHLQFMVR